MIIIIKGHTDQERTVIDTDQYVVIDEAFQGPIFTNGNVCLSVNQHAGGFDMRCYRGTPEHEGVLPSGSTMAYITPDFVEDLAPQKVDESEELPKWELEIGDMTLSELRLAVDLYGKIKDGITDAANKEKGATNV